MTDRSLPEEFRSAAVVSHAGYRGAEHPLRVERDGAWRQVTEILQRWRDPAHDYFRVRLDHGEPTLLRHTLDADDWEIGTRG